MARCNVNLYGVATVLAEAAGVAAVAGAVYWGLTLVGSLGAPVPATMIFLIVTAGSVVFRVLLGVGRSIHEWIKGWGCEPDPRKGECNG